MSCLILLSPNRCEESPLCLLDGGPWDSLQPLHTDVFNRRRLNQRLLLMPRGEGLCLKLRLTPLGKVQACHEEPRIQTLSLHTLVN